MLLDPRFLFGVGTSLIALLLWMLYAFSPAPGELSAVHGEVIGMDSIASCETCHRSGGVEEGCLDCHAEIQEQLQSGRGLHDFLEGSGELRCGTCHAEHFGHGFELISDASWGDTDPKTFSHPHVEFGLTGSHDRLECAQCHQEQRKEPFSLPAFPEQVRARTFLGLDQSCATCHTDPHADGRAPCADCHGQETFDPPLHFDHEEHFPLGGAHAEVSCQGCHELPPSDAPFAALPFPFTKPKGKDCQSCHESPHQVDFGEDCESCHALSEPHWTIASSRMTTDRHVRTGFPLVEPHDEVACGSCHPPEASFEERHPNPLSPFTRRTPENCETCHGDVHGGQFAGRFEACLDCHESHSFVPSTFGADRHAERFELLGKHQEVDCQECHQVPGPELPRMFAGTAHECRTCHPGPHAGQFASQIAKDDCTACHNGHAETFAISPFDHSLRTGFTLKGAHDSLECAQCHPPVFFENDGQNVLAQRFEGTERDCTFCHEDVHQGQFADRGEDCSSCHDSHFFQPTTFDHARHLEVFPLTGAHEAIPCVSCHAKPTVAGARIFDGTAKSCKECHSDPHAEQFAKQIEHNDCRACHNSIADTFSLRPFDHEAWTGHELKGAHARADCEGCHTEEKFELSSGESVWAQRFVDTPKQCSSCHTDVHHGQFDDYRSCATCHVSETRWTDIHFDHNSQSRFQLEGAHLKVPCSGCHKPEPAPFGEQFVRFKPLGTDCKDCHEIDPRDKDNR
ncbi:MAG: hypothetical protein RL885_24360 [Planctomycetota bacterium]